VEYSVDLDDVKARQDDRPDALVPVAPDPVLLRAGVYPSGIAAWGASAAALQALKKDGWLGLPAGGVGKSAVPALGAPEQALREFRLADWAPDKPDAVRSAAQSCVAEALGPDGVRRVSLPPGPVALLPPSARLEALLDAAELPWKQTKAAAGWAGLEL